MENNCLHRIEYKGREIVLLGTAHISKESIEQVKETIRAEMPDHVCIELDDGRLKTLTEPEQWKNLDLKTIIRQGQLSILVANITMASYQKRMGLHTGVKPGQELLAGVQVAQELGIPVTMADRDVRTTLRRAWRLTPWYRRFLLIGTLIQSLFDKTEVTEEQLREIKSQDTLGAMMNEFGQTFPELKQVVITERDHFLAGRIMHAPGKKVLAVVGAGHLEGIARLLSNEQDPEDEEKLNIVPPASPIGKWIMYAIPALFVGAMVYLGLTKGMTAVGDNLLYWVLVTGGFAALGACFALPHPLVVLVAFVVAPLKPIRPVIGTGVFTSFTQAWLVPPHVEELENISDEITHWRAWWHNRFLRIFLCALTPVPFTTLAYFIAARHIFLSMAQ